MVVTFAGDGEFLMNGQEFATAVQYGLADNRRSCSTTASTARSACNQEREYPGRVVGTHAAQTRISPRYARAFGGHGETVLRTDEFEPALEARARRKRPGDPACEGGSRGNHADTTLSAIREAAIAKRGR